MERQKLINVIEDAVTDMEYHNTINRGFDLNQKWYVTCVMDTERLKIKPKRELDTILFTAYADEFEKIDIYKGKEFIEKQKIKFQIFYNLDTNNVNVFIHFYYAKTREFLDIIYDTANKSVEDIIDDYYSKLSSLLKK